MSSCQQAVECRRPGAPHGAPDESRFPQRADSAGAPGRLRLARAAGRDPPNGSASRPGRREATAPET